MRRNLGYNKRPGVDAGWPILFAFSRARHRATRPSVGCFCGSDEKGAVMRFLSVSAKGFWLFLALTPFAVALFAAVFFGFSGGRP